MRNLARIASTFVAARWTRRFSDREQLLAWQERRVNRFLRERLPTVGFYRDYGNARLADLPVVDKSTMLANFAAFNARGVSLERALSVAVDAERSRDFLPTLDGLTVGLSSGTSGTRGVFLVSAAERDRWVGLTLARVLTDDSLRRLANPFAAPLHVAFFLRANSNLYESLGSRRLRFAFHDLAEPMDAHVQRLNEAPPDIVVAPPTVLRGLAERALDGALFMAPRQIVSVAETLEPDDCTLIAKAFGVAVQQIYQATEGFLGASCEAGRVHLNEDFVHVEPEWLDEARHRFRPVVTDFSRTTQLIVRYRLDDVLIDAPSPCACGRATRSLDGVEGRADDVLWRQSLFTGRDEAVYPDLIRRSMALCGDAIGEYRIEQHAATWQVRLQRGGEDRVAVVTGELNALCDGLGVSRPSLMFEPWRDVSVLDKRRRIRCVARAAASVLV